jgi:hypothetical protein
VTVVDPRIYRAFLALVAFAVIIFGFSLQNEPHSLGTSIAPGDFFTNAHATVNRLAKEYPDRSPGSPGDQKLAADVAGQLQGHGFTVQTKDFAAQTASGSRILETVTATRPGLGGGTVVVVSHRDAIGSPAVADLSGTAVLLDLEQALSGETLNRSVMLVSTSGQIGAAGATQLAQSLTGQPVDAVVLLGDLTSRTVSEPVVVPWSSGTRLAPPMLRNTLSAFVAAQAGIPSPESGIAGQFVRLAFPFAITEQAPFAGAGIPAVLLSVSGDRPTPAYAALGSQNRIASLGTAVLQTVNAVDTGPAIAAPSAYLVLSGKMVPLWAVRLLVLALILPVVATTIDAVARTRRRGHAVARWVGWVLAGVVPFFVGLLALLAARAVGALSAKPPQAVGAGAVPITGGDVAVMAVVLLLVVACFFLVRPLCLRLLARFGESARRPESPAADAAAVSLSVVMCLLAVIVWVLNPFAALLLVPALHLWLWLAQPGARSQRWVVLPLVLVAIVPGVLVLIYYANAYGLSPLALAWSLTLMTGGALSVVTALYWCVALGCLASALVIATRAMRANASALDPLVTVRGPATYAGPGSLGGTKSALRR